LLFSWVAPPNRGRLKASTAPFSTARAKPAIAKITVQFAGICEVSAGRPPGRGQLSGVATTGVRRRRPRARTVEAAANSHSL